MKVVVVMLMATLLIAAEAAVDVAEEGQLTHRKLAQWQRRRYDPGSSGDRQFARNQAALVNTQQAIRAATESGANPYATRGATNVGSANAYLASQRSDLVYAPFMGRKRS